MFRYSFSLSLTRGSERFKEDVVHANKKQAERFHPTRSDGGYRDFRDSGFYGCSQLNGQQG
ncbi:protein of unknown function [Shewanella benthica]|uniref:Uncharacterized protein n=1 Tax=Shewanella benthica TaxID=43661 RepID=A0A330LZ37_9GAMM|nr:protein of unknown function [Shewanella benthica]